jgi:hypothetical protein
MSELTRQDRCDWNLHAAVVNREGESAELFAKSLYIIRERKLWRCGNYRSWTQYIEKALPMSRRRAFYRLADTGERPTLPETDPDAPEATDGHKEAEQGPQETSGAQTTATSEPPEKAVAAVLDGRGEPVTDPRLQPAFEALGTWKGLEAQLGRVKTMLDELSGGPAGVFLRTEAQNAERLRRDILNILNFARPYTTCPYCQGKGCDGCKETGWTTRPAYDNAPEELRY